VLLTKKVMDTKVVQHHQGSSGLPKGGPSKLMLGFLLHLNSIWLTCRSIPVDEKLLMVFEHAARAAIL
jgi:hypothetical protein